MLKVGIHHTMKSPYLTCRFADIVWVCIPSGPPATQRTCTEDSKVQSIQYQLRLVSTAKKIRIPKVILKMSRASTCEAGNKQRSESMEVPTYQASRVIGLIHIGFHKTMRPTVAPNSVRQSNWGRFRSAPTNNRYCCNRTRIIEIPHAAYHMMRVILHRLMSNSHCTRWSVSLRETNQLIQFFHLEAGKEHWRIATRHFKRKPLCRSTVLHQNTDSELMKSIAAESISDTKLGKGKSAKSRTHTNVLGSKGFNRKKKNTHENMKTSCVFSFKQFLQGAIRDRSQLLKWQKGDDSDIVIPSSLIWGTWYQGADDLWTAQQKLPVVHSSSALT